MIEKLLQIQGLDAKINQRLNHFNATLPILIEVLKKTKANHYLLMVGNKMLETKSLKELEIGSRYFALMQHSSSGGIMLSSLKVEPKIPKGVMEFGLEEMKAELFENQKMKDLLEYALDKISQAKNKDEFLSWGFFLLGLQKKILSFWVKDGYKRIFFQFKKQKQELIFYALFPHLGELCGKIYKNRDGINLALQVSYKSVASFLEEHQKELKGFSQICVGLNHEITPLFLPSEQLLDLKI